MESALDRQLTMESRLWETLVREGGKGVPGSARLRRVMLLRPQGSPAKSVLEIHVGHVLVAAGLGHFIRNLPVDDARSKIDAAYLEELVAVEADSKQFHSTRTQRARDQERQTRLEELGWFFVRVTFEEAYGDPDGFVRRLREVLRTAGTATQTPFGHVDPRSGRVDAPKTVRRAG